MLSTILSVVGATAMLIVDGIRIANSSNPMYVVSNITERLAQNLMPIEAKAVNKGSVIVGQVTIVCLSPEPLSKALLINVVRQASCD